MDNQLSIGHSFHPLWVCDLQNYTPINLGKSWGTNKAAFNISLSGRIWLTDNTERPCHRDIVDGEGMDKTNLSGLYSWHNGIHELFAYPELEEHINSDAIRSGLRSLIGVNGIPSGTPVISHWTRKILFTL